MNNVEFRKNRTRCPKCNSSDGFAGIVSINGKACGDPLQHGKCHACDAMIWPDDQASDVQHEAKQARPESAIVKDSIIEQTDAQTSNLHRVLINIGGEGMAAHLRQWRIGTDADGRTLFHYLNPRGLHQTTKGMEFDAAGKRIKTSNARFGVRLPAKYVDLSSNEGHRPCLFGEQWMQAGQSMIDHRDSLNPRKCTYNEQTLIGLVESEKTAIVASFVMPQMIWIASGGTSGITDEKAKALHGRTVLIMFDCDETGRNAAAKSAERIAKAGGTAIHQIDGVPAQDYIFTGAQNGFDIADHIMDMLAIRAAVIQNGSTLPISQGAA